MKFADFEATARRAYDEIPDRFKQGIDELIVSRDAIKHPELADIYTLGHCLTEAGALAGVDTLEGYTDWMKGLFTPVPDGHYELRAFAVDDERSSVTAFAVFHGTHTAEGGPVPPTGKSVAADYVYVMEFDDGRIRHMTKIWNDGISLQQLGWM
jgi:predicted ester cyclase